jgi:peptidoglycan/LPS O-acetylase OafA/YrhL
MPANTPAFRLRDLTGPQLGAAIQATHIRGLDAFRAIAVLLVLLGHGIEADPAWSPWLGPLASLGVKLFFVLSGLLITRLLLDEIDRSERIDLMRFYRRRFGRLMPAFYLYLVVAIGILLVRGKPVPWDAVASAALYVVNYFQAFNGAPNHIVSHCWSLAVEEQFYVIWPLLLAWVMRRRWQPERVLVIAIVTIWLWRLSLVLFTDTSEAYLYRALDTRADELLMGCLLAVLTRQPAWQARLASCLRAPGLVPALIVMLYVSTTFTGDDRLLRFGIAFMFDTVFIGVLVLAVSALATHGEGWIARLLNHATLVRVGQVSYFMYLFHGLIMHTSVRLIERFTGSFALGLLGAIALVYFAARVSFVSFESPMRRWVTGSSR